MSGRGRAADATRKGGPMKSWSSRLLLIAAVAGVAGCATWRQWTHTGEAGAAPASPPAGTAPAHVMLAPGALKWQSFPLGGEEGRGDRPGARHGAVPDRLREPGRRSTQQDGEALRAARSGSARGSRVARAARPAGR